MSPFSTAVMGGILGGIAAGVVITLSIALFGRQLAETFVRHHAAYLERRFKESVLDVVLARVTSFFDQGERIGQIAKRVVEILQLLLHRGAVQDDAAAVVQQGLRDIGAFAPKPAAQATAPKQI